MIKEFKAGVWLDHICAEGYNNKWTLHYLTDEEAEKCFNSLHNSAPSDAHEALKKLSDPDFDWSKDCEGQLSYDEWVVNTAKKALYMN